MDLGITTQQKPAIAHLVAQNRRSDKELTRMRDLLKRTPKRQKK